MNNFSRAAHLRFVSSKAATRLAAVLVAWGCVQPLSAWAQATVTWNGSTDTTWSQPDSTSWSGATYISGDTAVFAGSGAGTVTITAGGVTPGQTNVTNGSYTFSGGPLGGSGGIAKSGAGTLTLSGSNSYAGTTGITAGVLNIQNASALGGTAAGTTVASGAALQIQGGITVTGESLSLNGDGITSDGALRNISGTNTWTGAIGIDGVGTILETGNVAPLVRIASDLGQLSLSGPIQIAAPAGATSASHMLVQGNGNVVISGNIIGGKDGNVSFTSSANGSGARTLSGSNTYLGWTQVAGNLTAEGGFAIPDTSRVVSTSLGGRLVLNASETIGGLASSATGMQINLNAHTLTIGADNTTPLAGDWGGASYLGTIIGTGGIVKVGTGVLTLSGSNSYTGATSINAGTLALGAGGSFASSPLIEVNSGAFLNVAATGGFSLASTQTLGGRGTLQGAATFVSGAKLAFDATGPLIAANQLSFTNFGISSLAGVNWDSLALNSPYTLIDGIQNFASAGLLNFGELGKTPVGTNREAYFQAGGDGGTDLQLVVVPEPGALALAGIGVALAAWAARRRR